MKQSAMPPGGRDDDKQTPADRPPETVEPKGDEGSAPFEESTDPEPESNKDPEERQAP